MNRVSRNYILLEKNPLSFCVRTLLHSRECIIGSNACSKKCFTFEQPHTVEQNTLIVCDKYIYVERTEKGKDRVEKSLYRK